MVTDPTRFRLVLGPQVVVQRRQNVSSIVELALLSPVGRNQDIEPPGCHKACKDDDERNMAYTKTKNVQRIVLEFVKRRVRKAIDDGEDWGGHVAHQGSPEGGNIPVLALANDLVQI